MSLYNMLCGNNHLFPIYFAVLSTVKPISVGDVERFRDVYTQVVDGSPRIVIYTRTGGGNRDYYPNEALTSHPMYLQDWDDDFDCTFASYEFSVPEPWEAKMLNLIQAFDNTILAKTPREKFDAAMASLQGENTEPSQEPSDQQLETLISIIKEMCEELKLV